MLVDFDLTFTNVATKNVLGMGTVYLKRSYNNLREFVKTSRHPDPRRGVGRSRAAARDTT